MKAIFIAFDQAYYERIVEMLHKSGCRGFTAFNDVVGRGWCRASSLLLRKDASTPFSKNSMRWILQHLN